MDINQNKILVFDNEADMLNNIDKHLKVIGFVSIKCDSVYKANEKWNEHYTSLKGLVLDLSMLTDGLTEKQRSRSNRGLSTGWVWFIDNVINGQHPRPDLIKRTLLFSDYIDDLKKDLKDNPHDEKEKAIFEQVGTISKADNDRWKLLREFFNNRRK